MKHLRSPRVVVALGCVLLWIGVARGAGSSSGPMAAAATRFLASLTPAQRAEASFVFDSDERMKWHFIPTEMFPRRGLVIKTMTPPQRTAARELLKTGLSEHGYLTASAIMDLETVLKSLEMTEGMIRDPERYFFSVFGTPTSTGTWGWRVEGHHVSLHFNVVNGTLIAAAPTFFGTNPAEVRSGPSQGLRILAPEEDTARALIESLDPSRRAKALLEIAAPNDIVTMNQVAIQPLSPAGVTAADLTPAQRDLLMRVVGAYTSLMAPDIAADRMAKIQKAGADHIAFAWAGALQRGEKHYYRIQGQTFLIEYDNTQNDGNHVHSVWRDFDGDFGRDLLREHIKSAH